MSETSTLPPPEYRDMTLKEFFESRCNMLLALARQYKTNQVSAEDILQEAITEALLYGFQFQGEAQAVNYLKRCIRQASIRLNRRLLGMRDSADDPRKAVTGVDQSQLDSEQLDDVSEIVITQEEIDRVRKALEQLSLPQQELIWLRFTESMTIEEIAEHLTISASTVRSRLEKALQQLRELLGDGND